MENIVEQGLLYDFYGELLTDHQKQIYEAAVYDDMSLGEIAAEQGISRQGVHDLIKRCDKILQGYEDKLHLIDKFRHTKKMVQEIHTLAEPFSQVQDEERFQSSEQLSAAMKRICDLSNEIVEEL